MMVLSVLKTYERYQNILLNMVGVFVCLFGWWVGFGYGLFWFGLFLLCGFCLVGWFLRKKNN